MNIFCVPENFWRKESSLPLWNRIDQYFKRRCMKYLEGLFSKETITPDDMKWDNVKQILVVRPHDQLGDFLLSTPALRALRERFAEATIGIIVRDYCAGAVQHNLYIDRVMIFYENGLRWTPKRIWTLWKQLHNKWDMAIVFNSESHSLTSDLLATLSGAKYILGSERFPFHGCTKNFFYNLIAPDSGSDKHQIERNLDIVHYIGATMEDRSETVHVTDDERDTVRNEFKNVYIHNDKNPIIGLHIGANKVENRWPVERFAKLANELHKKHRLRIVVFWGPKETELSRRFRQHVQCKPAMIEPTTLRRQAIHFSLCDGVVCNDTGIMHLCAAVGTPLVALFGPTDPTYWKPIGKKFIAVRGNGNKIENVTVEQVVRELKKLIQ